MYWFLTFPLWQTITLAHEEAVASGSRNTQPKHIMSLLLRDPNGIAVRIIKDLGALPVDAENLIGARWKLPHRLSKPGI